MKLDFSQWWFKILILVCDKLNRKLINRNSVFCILHHYKFHPYHVSLHQALDGMNFVNRDFVNRLNETMTHFFDIVLFIDEAFINHGNVNLHNITCIFG